MRKSLTEIAIDTEMKHTVATRTENSDSASTSWPLDFDAWTDTANTIKNGRLNLQT